MGPYSLFTSPYAQVELESNMFGPINVRYMFSVWGRTNNNFLITFRKKACLAKVPKSPKKTANTRIRQDIRDALIRGCGCIVVKMYSQSKKLMKKMGYCRCLYR